MNKPLRHQVALGKCRRCFFRKLTRLGAALLVTVLPLLAREPRFLSHYYYVNDDSSRQSLQSNFEHISLVSPQWFSVDRKGELESSLDPAVVDWAAMHRLPLMPLLVNQEFQPEVAHAVLCDEQIESSLTARILELATANHFYGIQVDFENIPPDDRDRFTKFIGRLAKAFHRRRMKLSVAVVPSLAPAPHPTASTDSAPYGWSTNEHSRAFDYRRLGKVADFVSLMTYDEYTSPEQPGPIAGLPWVEACLQKALEFIPRKKLLLGMPLYYRHWSGKSVIAGPYTEALSLATRWQAKVEMNPEQRESTFRYEDGQNLHVIWLQDARGLAEKMALVRRYRLAGFSAWRLGQEDPAAWNGVFSGVPRRP